MHRNISRTTTLKENYSFLVADENVQVQRGTEHGIYSRDTRFLSCYEWSFGRPVQTLRVFSERPDTVEVYYAEFPYDYQTVGIRRRLRLAADRLSDTLWISNTSGAEQTHVITLHTAADFADIFEVRRWHRSADGRRRPPVAEDDAVRYSYTAADGVTLEARIASSWPAIITDEGTLEIRLALPPGNERRLEITVALGQGADSGEALVGYEEWRKSAPETGAVDAEDMPPERRVLSRAIDDLRALLLATEDGPVPAAGIPWYAAVFGRDALLTCLFQLPYWPDVAAATLRYLARYQAHTSDHYRAAAPGKIIHELRFGELSRLGTVPFGPYYGTIDATALYLILLDRVVCEFSDYRSLAVELQPSWRGALDWLRNHADRDGDGFLEYQGSAEGKGQGLPIQSWKDSDDSMSHADGTLARGTIAPVEVQGYAFAALHAGARLCEQVGDGTEAERLRHAAKRMSESFHAAFWLEELGTYAMALDGAKQPLAVKSSNAGHLLWAGIVPDSHAVRVRDALFDPELWTGWGFRTLGEREHRYNPLSYHNGSVWPHDTAIAAAGLARYGFRPEARTVRKAMFDLAISQPDLRLPELIGGFNRDAGPPVAYPVACKPQAWDAAALVYLLQA